MELRFLRKINLPIPRECPFCRINEKLKRMIEELPSILMRRYVNKPKAQLANI
jgi:hypothetical protein